MTNCKLGQTSEETRTRDKQVLVYPLQYSRTTCEYTALKCYLVRTCGLAWVRVRNLRVTLSFTPCTPFKA